MTTNHPTTYDEACREAADRQGLTPILSDLSHVGIDHQLEQTGGWCMAVSVHIVGGPTYVITHGEQSTGADGYLVMRYRPGGWEDGEDEGTDVFPEGADQTTAVEFLQVESAAHVLADHMDEAEVTTVEDYHEVYDVNEVVDDIIAAVGIDIEEDGWPEDHGSDAEPFRLTNRVTLRANEITAERHGTAAPTDDNLVYGDCPVQADCCSPFAGETPEALAANLAEHVRLWHTVTAQPYDARQCPECEVWVYTAAGPFAEGDPTKTLADWNHWEAHHLDPAEDRTKAIGFPFFDFNTEPVEAVKVRP